MKLLAGPAVRRVDDQGAYLWCVLDQQAGRISAKAWTSADKQDKHLCCECLADEAQWVKLGQGLFVYLLKLSPRDGVMPKGQALYYDLDIDGRGLAQFGLIGGNHAITYPGEKLPSFFLPTEHQNVLQGSCRKPHAGDDRKAKPDQMLAADAMLANQIGNLAMRPSQLYLTGDQIYADDVASALLAGLIDLAKGLRGEEQIPDPKRSGRTMTPATLKLASRHLLMTDKVGFTSGESKNHLMTLGEYMGMYLTSWGGVSLSLPKYNSVRFRLAKSLRAATSIDFIVSGGVRGGYQGRYAYDCERSRAVEFLSKCWRVRRLMANISSYMIFDDHDVTDDWNLTPEIRDRLRDHPFSKRVVGNALAAYWACQDWGNDPENSDHQRLKTLLQKAHGDGDSQALAEADQALIERRWGYEINQQPYVMVLDTRTHRVFDNEGRPGLLDVQGMAELEQALVNPQLKGKTVLLVSAAPVYGFKTIELLQVNMPRRGAEAVDRECWIGNQTQYQRLKLAFRQSEARDIVVFSGDVHYGFARRELAGSTSIWQLTSSALANSPTGGGFFLNILQKEAIFSRENTPYLIPNNREKVIINHQTTIGLLTMREGRPVGFTALCCDDRGRPYEWQYDLTRPVLFNQPSFADQEPVDMVDPHQRDERIIYRTPGEQSDIKVDR